MINPFVWVADHIAARVVGYPIVAATKDCAYCGASQGRKHRLSGCEGNERDVRRGFLVYRAEVVSDDEVDRRYAEVLEQHRRNQAEKEN